MKIQTVDIDVVGQALKDLELRFEENVVEGVHTIGLGFENLGVRLRMQGDNAILVSSGQILVDFSDAQLEELVDSCNDWNRDRLMPKAYPLRMPDNTLRIMLEASWGVEAGANDEQVRDWLGWMLNTFLQATIELLQKLGKIEVQAPAAE